MNKILKSILFVGILIFLGIIVFKIVNSNGERVIIQEAPSSLSLNHFTSNSDKSKSTIVDFTQAAEISTPPVVNISSIYINRNKSDFYEIPEEFKDFFGDDFYFFRPGPKQNYRSETSGSGVIVSKDGYIITNNHVISDADEIFVTLNDKRNYKAKQIGSDPATDLAIIKIEGNDFPVATFGNSDEMKIGEWVLAVGNPFNLASTVTAGIISAKGRSLHILKDNYAVESFIQTDAAINPGNSGGALVNLKGELIGINTAIATPTGTYAGYAFAIPSGIVKKVTEDLINYGIVQRGFLGVIIRDISEELYREKKLGTYEGVYIDSVLYNGAAYKADIKKGDVIISVDGSQVNSPPNLQEIISRKKPGQTVTIILLRKGKEKVVSAILQNMKGSEKLLKPKEKTEILDLLGIELEELSKDDLEILKIKHGIKVIKISSGIIKNSTDMRENFIITKVDNIPIKSIKELVSYLDKKKSGGIILEGIYPGIPRVFYYAFGMLS